jgi:hypothetical protein
MRHVLPWGLIATVSLLGIALGISASHNRLWDSIVIAVLIVPGLGLIVGLAILRAQGRR